MNKLKKILLNLFYGLPFGLKGADTEILGSGDKDNTNTTISQETSDERVGKHLLKGEVTQEVEELRYRTYKVANESEKYDYIGNGIAVKKDKDNSNDKKTKYNFSQDNENVCESVLKTLQQVGGYGLEKYRFEIEYNSFSRFKIEKFATKVDVNVNENDGIIETTLHFSSEPNPYDRASKPFVNELLKALETKTEYEVSRNEILSSIKSLTFSTYKASNEEDFVNYCFIGGSKFKNIEQIGYEILITFSWDEYLRVPLNLESKYFSKSMSDKYKRNDKKNNAVSIKEVERKRYCSICGKEMSIYDADIQEAGGELPICKDCLTKTFNNEK